MPGHGKARSDTGRQCLQMTMADVQGNLHSHIITRYSLEG